MTPEVVDKMADQHPIIAEDKATRSDALDLRSLTVIGVMHGSGGTAALLRSSGGDIVRVSVGEEAFGIRVTAIGDDRILMIDRWGRTHSLALPHG